MTVTETPSVALVPAELLMLNEHAPAPTGVTTNAPLEGPAAIVATFVHVVDEVLNAPEYDCSLTTTVCASPAPVPKNVSDDGLTLSGPGAGEGVGVCTGAGVELPLQPTSPQNAAIAAT